jgi:hypothetical protein
LKLSTSAQPEHPEKLLSMARFVVNGGDQPFEIGLA